MFKNYTMNQLILPLDIEMKLQANDIAFHVHNLVESIPYEAFAPFLQQLRYVSFRFYSIFYYKNFELI